MAWVERMATATRWEVVSAYLRLPHAVPVLIVLATTAVLAVVIDRDAALWRYLSILLAMLGAQVVIGVANELIDIELDRTARPDKPLVSGLVSPRGAAVVLVAGGVVMLVAGARLGASALALLLLGSTIGVVYSFWFKRSLFAFVPYLVAIPLLPVWVATALGKYDSKWLVLFPMGCGALLSVHVAQSLPDFASDRAAGITTLTTWLGERRALLVCWIALLGSALTVVLVSPDRTIGVAVAMGVALAILTDAWLYRANPRRGVQAAFPVAALSTAVLGVAWAYAAGTT